MVAAFDAALFMDKRPIGVLDSGVGGLSIWRQIVQQLPSESTIFVADSKNCPYGGRSAKEIYKLAKPLVGFLASMNVKLIVLACNTITVHCLARFREDFPMIPIVGTVPIVKKAAEVSLTKRIGVLSTKATAKSANQKRLIEQFATGCKVINRGTDKLVPLVERAEVEGERVNILLQKELKTFIDGKTDTLALGCSHFPFLHLAMQKILGPGVSILEPGEAIARQVRNILTSNETISEGKVATHQMYTTGIVKNFKEASEKLLGAPFASTIQSTKHVIL